MKRHKWGIFWLVMLAWNAESLGYHLGLHNWWRTVLDLAIVVMCGAYAYHHLTAGRRPYLTAAEIAAAIRSLDERRRAQ